MFKLTTTSKTVNSSLKVRSAPMEAKGEYLTMTAGQMTSHKVTYTKEDNSFICDCHAFKYGHGMPCKHIVSVVRNHVKNAEIKIKE